MVFAFWSYCYVLLVWSNWCSPLQIKLSTILAVKWIFCFQQSSTEHYQYTSKAAVIKLSFWVHWHVMLLMCCRLQELKVTICSGVTDRQGCWRGLGHCTNLHLWVSLWLTILRPKHCPRFFIDLPWLPQWRWDCQDVTIWMMKGWNELQKGAIS